MIQVGDRYQHYKGGTYRIVAVGKIEATLTPAVVYMSEKDGQVWVRPWDDFFSNVDETTPRFAPMSSSFSTTEYIDLFRRLNGQTG